MVSVFPTDGNLMEFIFFTASTWGFPRCSKDIYNRQNITASGSTLSVCMYPLKKVDMPSTGPPTCGTHAVVTYSKLHASHGSQIPALILNLLDVFTFNCPWNYWMGPKVMNQPATPDLTLLATRRQLKASCHFPFFFFFNIDSISVYIPIKSHNEVKVS